MNLPGECSWKSLAHFCNGNRRTPTPVIPETCTRELQPACLASQLRRREHGNIQNAANPAMAIARTTPERAGQLANSRQTLPYRIM
jgi:hypothetical protein